jgi:lipopolysaccharide/colanic/teichoic acid biosynthesis glycosyltransferase
MGKRCVDLVCAVLLGAVTLVLLPFMLSIAWISLGFPLFFKQRRVGLDGKEFDILKVRSMTSERDASGLLLPDERRITRFGRLLRRFRLDELPSILNLLRGDISMVGPRPLPRSSIGWPEHAQLRHSVRPGLTGLAQVSGNTLLSDREKLAVDLYYVSNQSFLTDTVILAKTVRTVVMGERRDEALIAMALERLNGDLRGSI